MSVTRPETERELVNKNQASKTEVVMQKPCSQMTEQRLNEARSVLQVITHSHLSLQ